jgi:hypothetical protein
MKPTILTLVVGVLMLLSGCATSFSTNEKQIAADPTVEKKEEPTSTSNVPRNDIIGTWKLMIDAYDQNENQELENEERKKGMANNNTLQFNANGTCRIQNIFNGTYTIKEEAGKKLLTIQRKKIEGEETADPIPDKYYIKSVTREELILLVIDGGSTTTFWIFKRIQ